MALTGDPIPPPNAAPFAERGADTRSANGDSQHNPASEAFHKIPELLAELRAYARYYIGAKLDSFKVRARTVAIFAVLGILGLIAACAVIATCVFLVLWGLANALGRLLWHQYWAGQVIVGVLVLGGIALALRIVLKRMTRTARAQIEQKYEQHRVEQRVNLGHDVHERAAEHGN
jgi:hypothetical protein